jgi:RNA polymerase sigma-70 factor (ECF subfamily)
LAFSVLYNEWAILSRIADGDEKAFAEIFDHYRPNIYTVIFNLTDSREMADEIVQDVFLKVWLNRDTILEIQNFGAWVYTIAKNGVFTALQKEKIQNKRLSDWQISSSGFNDQSTSAQSIMEEKENSRLLLRAVERLPKKQQQTYKMIREQGMSRQQVADTLQVSPETVKENLQLATRSVRAFYIQNGGLLVLFLLLAKMQGLC